MGDFVPWDRIRKKNDSTKQKSKVVVECFFSPYLISGFRANHHPSPVVAMKMGGIQAAGMKAHHDR